jgi:two-component system NtrC family sensor kinase
MDVNVTTDIVNHTPPSKTSELDRYFSTGIPLEKVLIVAYLPIPRQELADELSLKYECHQASSALDAIKRLKEETFAVVITDTMLRGPSGIELMRYVVRHYEDTSVIVLSDVSTPQRVLDSFREGTFDYLIKPCEPEVLRMTVTRAIECRNLRTEARRYKKDLEARNQELEVGKAELQRLQSQIVHSEKMASLGQLAAGVAHELNNPVGFVYGNLDILESRIKDIFKLLTFYDYAELTPDKASAIDQLKEDMNYSALSEDINSMIADCLEGAIRIRDIVQNLRTFSRLDQAEYKRTDLHEGIDSTLRLLSKYFSSENIKLIRDFGDVPEIEGFAGQLNQVWMNLLVNAAQAVEKGGGEVRIKTSFDGDSVVVSISDTGRGIEPEYMSRIFDPFFTTKPVGEGAGLGLAISFGIIERHKGKIGVVSEPGKGSTFAVTIPVNGMEPAEPPLECDKSQHQSAGENRK